MSMIFIDHKVWLLSFENIISDIKIILFAKNSFKYERHDNVSSTEIILEITLKSITLSYHFCLIETRFSWITLAHSPV